MTRTKIYFLLVVIVLGILSNVAFSQCDDDDPCVSDVDCVAQMELMPLTTMVAEHNTSDAPRAPLEENYLNRPTPRPESDVAEIYHHLLPDELLDLCLIRV